MIGSQETPKLLPLQDRNDHVGFGLELFQKFEVTRIEATDGDIVDHLKLALDVATTAVALEVGICDLAT